MSKSTSRRFQISSATIPTVTAQAHSRFTGNRFEFRAVGSEANCASAQIVLNTAVAEALTDFKTRVDALIAKGEEKFAAILSVVKEDIKTCAPIHFDGNGYSDEWVAEAERRGLDTEKSCPVIFDRYLDDSSVKMFESMKVMNRHELEARNEVKWETYTKKIQIEARVFGDLSMNHIIPVATHYQSQLAKNVQSMVNIFGKDEALKLADRNIALIREIAERTETIEKRCRRPHQRTQGSQQDCRCTRARRRLPRHRGAEARQDPLPHRQARTRRQR